MAIYQSRNELRTSDRLTGKKDVLGLLIGGHCLEEVLNIFNRDGIAIRKLDEGGTFLGKDKSTSFEVGIDETDHSKAGLKFTLEVGDCE